MRIPLFLALVGTLCSVPTAHADDDTELPKLQPQVQLERTFQVRISNVKPSLIAWWLDPVNHEPPTGMSLPPRPQTDGGILQSLPYGVSRIVAVDPQNALLVFGTYEGAQRLASTIRFLDRPLRQVEIEAQFFRVDADSVEKLTPQLKPMLPQTGVFRTQGDIYATLSALMKENKAVILTAPRATAINNMKADLSSRTEIPTKVQVSGKDIPKGLALTLANRRSLTVTSTINNDNTITLLIDGEQRTELEGEQTTGNLVLELLKMPQIVANLRDGETIVIEEKQLQQPDSPRRSATKTFVFLVPRIIRRTGAEPTQ